MEYQKDIIVVDRLGVVRTDCEEEYLAHLLCLGGTCRYRFNGRDFELHAGDVSIVRKRKMLEKIEPSDDFRCKIIYATPGFINLCTPQSNYGIKGSLALFLNPVMHLTPEQQIVCRRDFDLLELRIKDTEHRFYREVLINAMQTAILDFFRFPCPPLWRERHLHAKRFHYEPFPQNAGRRDVPRVQGSDLLRRPPVRHLQISVGSVEKGKRVCRQLLDQPLYDTRYYPFAT